MIRKGKAILEGVSNTVFKKEEIEKLAKERLKICETSGENGSFCHNHSRSILPYCKNCGCPLATRTRNTDDRYRCPIGKW